MDKATDKIRVYLAGPTLNSDERREIMENLRNNVLEAGATLSYDWMSDKTKYSPRELFRKSSDGVLQADLVIAEVTFPSTGVGQQISLAISKRIPVLALHAAWKQNSGRFLEGSQGDLLKFVRYHIGELPKILKLNLKTQASSRMVKFNFISTPEINSDLEKVSEKMGISRSQMVRLILKEWIIEKEKND